MAGSRRTATRVTPGAISLSNSSHFALMPYSNAVKPVMLPPGRARLATKPSADRVDHLHKYDRHVRVACCNAATRGAGRGEDHVRREPDQFRRISAKALGISMPPSGCRSSRCDRRSSPTPQPLQEGRDTRLSLPDRLGDVHEHANTPHPLELLRAAPRTATLPPRCQGRDELAPLQCPVRRAVLPTERIAQLI